MMVAGADYRERDRVLARRFAKAAEAAGLERIIYLGGLGETGDRLSDHLAREGRWRQPWPRAPCRSRCFGPP